MFKGLEVLLAAGSLGCAVMVMPVLSHADSDVSTDPGQRYITIQTYWSDMSKSQREAVVGQAVQAIKNEIAQKAPMVKNATLQNLLLSPALMTEIQTNIERYLDDTDELESSQSRLARDAALLLPRAILLTLGASGGFHWTLGGAASMDIGLVVMFPSFQTVIDTAQRDANGDPVIIRNDQFNLFDAAIVGVPHGYGGVGYGGGGTLSMGVAGIWGKMSSASDFYGVIAAGSGKAQFPVTEIPVIGALLPDGADLDIGVVGNLNHVFALVRIGVDKGAEAQATLDGEVGAVIPFKDLVEPFSDPKTWIKNVVGDVKDALGSSSKTSSKTPSKDDTSEDSSKSSRAPN